MTHCAIITIEFTDWWLSGTGRSGSGDIDAVPHRDRYGCPALPMSQVKGQLRESAQRLAEAAETQAAAAAGEPARERPELAWDKTFVAQLFGAGGSQSGALAFRGDATLDEATARWLSANVPARDQLTRRRSATKIDRLGVAAEDTLRALEAAVPLTLTGKVFWIAEGKPLDEWPQLLDAACAATLAFGKLKTDGYGRAVARCAGATGGV